MKKIWDIKKEAFDTLKMCWAEAAMIGLLGAGIVLAVYCFILVVGRLTGVIATDSIMPVFTDFNLSFGIISILVLAASYIASIPLFFGIRWFYWQAVNGRIMPLSSIFACYSSSEMVKKSIIIKLSVDIPRISLLGVLMLLGAGEAYMAAKLWELSGNEKAVGIAVMIGCAVVGAGIIIIYVLYGIQYIPIGYLVAERPDADMKEIARLSRSIIEKRYFHMFASYITCGAWILSCVLVFPILIVQPILIMLSAVFVRDGLEGENQVQDEAAEASEINKEVEKVCVPR